MGTMDWGGQERSPFTSRRPVDLRLGAGSRQGTDGIPTGWPRGRKGIERGWQGRGERGGRGEAHRRGRYWFLQATRRLSSPPRAPERKALLCF
jgi:hypothetical protein